MGNAFRIVRWRPGGVFVAVAMAVAGRDNNGRDEPRGRKTGGQKQNKTNADAVGRLLKKSTPRGNNANMW